MGHEGYTLHETLIAIALIGLGVLGLAINTSDVMRGNFRSDALTVATNLAQDKMEELRARTTLTSITNCGGSSSVAEPAEAQIAPTGGAGGIFSRCWVIQDSLHGNGLKQIDVTVSWRDYSSRSVTLSTLVYGR
jgi:type II secretory pathway pseudopilin PulG